MRRFAALVALLVLSLSRFGAVAMPSSAHAASIGRIEAHELAAPAVVRVAAHALHEAAPREQARAFVPWLADRTRDALGELAESRRSRSVFADARHAALHEWRAFTYDATAPPSLS